MNPENNRERNTILKIVCIGSKGVGKTQVLQRCGEEKTPYRFQFQGECCTFQVEEGLMMQKLSKEIKQFSRRVTCCLLIYDITSYSSFVNAKEILQSFMDNQDWSQKEIQQLPVFVIANKIDLIEQQQVKFKEVKQWIMSLSVNAELIKCSAKNGMGIEYIRNEVIQKSLIFNKQYPSSAPTKSISLLSKENSSPQKAVCK